MSALPRGYCPDCDSTHFAGQAAAVGRFRTEGPIGYQSLTAPDAPIRETRAEAIADGCLYMQRKLAADAESRLADLVTGWDS